MKKLSGSQELKIDNEQEVSGAGFLNYQKKMKYFPTISEQQDGKQYECNVRTPLTQLNLKGNFQNKRVDPNSKTLQAEVPHAGIWVRRTTTDFYHPSPLRTNQQAKVVEKDDMYSTEYNVRYNSVAAQSTRNQKFKTVEAAAGTRVPGSYKLTVTQKLPMVKKELTKLGKSRDDIQERLQEKIQ